MQRILTILVMVAFLICTSVSDAFAKKRVGGFADITQSSKYASLVVNASTGAVLHRHNADVKLHPASLTKMMTAYLIFQSIKAHKLSLNTALPVSRFAASQHPLKLWLKPGQMISLRDALYGVIVHSANDAAVVIAEAISGSEQAFAAKMTQTAMQLGMSNTVFRNASGLHNPAQVSTAMDMAKLAIALRRDFPEFYPLFSKRSFVYKGAVINAHNMVLKRYRGADGLKTGYVTASGFNLVTSVTRPEGSIIGVVLGGPSVASRDNHMMALLDKGYSHLALNSHHAHKHQVAEAEVQAERSIDVFAASQIDEELEEELPAMVTRAPARNIVAKRQHKVAPKAKQHVKVAAKIHNKMVNKNRPLTKLAHVKQVQEARGATKQLPTGVEFGKRSNKNRKRA